jgi:hypothetical protein
MPTNATQSPDTDGHLMIVDDSTGCEYDFFAAKKATDGSWSAYGTATFKNGMYASHSPWAVRASGVALGAGLIRASEVQAGVIPHALAIALPNTDSSTYVSPATHSDGRTAGGIPMGARLQLNPSFDISTLPADQRVIAKALQTYGAYVVETSGAVALYAQNTISTGSYRYPTSWSSGLTSGSTLLRNMRVVSAPALPPTDSWTASGCAQRYQAP